MSFIKEQNSLLEISHPLLKHNDVLLSVWRDDFIYPQISGNKWRKLKYNIEALRSKDFNCVASFGGPFSNHLHALAFAGKTFGFKTVGFIRGEIITPYNPTLKDATEWGMKLVPVSRADYRNKNDPQLIKQFTAPFEPCFLVPEGAANQLAIKGCAELAVEIGEQATKVIDYICAPCGTGTTLAGLIAGSVGPKVLGFSALKNNTDLNINIDKMLIDYGASASQWDIIHDYHFGGFAKMTAPLVSFMDEWFEQTGIQLDPVYTAKMLFGIFEMIKTGYFKPGSHIVAVHTGGLQGLRGMQPIIERLRAT